MMYEEQVEMNENARLTLPCGLSNSHVQILQAMPHAVIACDHNGSIRYLNPAAELLLGYSFREVQGLLMQSLLKMMDDNFAQAFQPGCEHRFYAQTKYGIPVLLSATCGSMKTAEGK